MTYVCVATGERECLFAPCSFLEPMGGEAVEVTPHGVVCKLHVRLNANAKALTLAELRGRRRAMHLAAFAFANADTARAVDRIAGEGRLDERLRRDRSFPRDVQEWLRAGGKEADLEGHVVSGGRVTFTAAGYLGYLRRGLYEARKRHKSVQAERFAADGGVAVSWERLWSIAPAPFHPELIAFADEAVRETCGTSHRLPSGPLHDAAEMAMAGVPTAMLFVQSLHGISHNKIEDTRREHLELAVRALDRLAEKTMHWVAHHGDAR